MRKRSLKFKEPVIVPDPEIVRQLTDMGFSLEGCKKAAFHTKNAGVEAAMNWVLEHSGDPDFNFPFVNPRYLKLINIFGTSKLIGCVRWVSNSILTIYTFQ